MSKNIEARIGYFEDELERELQLRRNSRGGQQVPNHGDFCQVTVSALHRLQIWAREFRAAVEADHKSTDVTKAAYEAGRQAMKKDICEFLESEAKEWFTKKSSGVYGRLIVADQGAMGIRHARDRILEMLKVK